MKHPKDFLSELFQLGQAIETLHEASEDQLINPMRSRIFAPCRTSARRLTQHPQIIRSNLKWLDVCLVAVLWFKKAEYGRSGMRPMDILEEIFGPNFARIQYLKRISSLLVQEIFFIEKQVLVSHENGRGEMVYPLRILLEEEVQIHRAFLEPLLDGNRSTTDERQGYRDNQEMILDWFAYLESLFEVQRVEFGFMHFPDSQSDYITPEQIKVNQHRASILQRMTTTPAATPLKQLIAKHRLSWDEITVLLYLIKADLDDNAYRDQNSILKLISYTYADRYTKRNLIGPDSKLVTAQLITCNGDAGGSLAEMSYCVSPSIKAQILSESATSTVSTLETLLKDAPFFIHRVPEQSLEELILAPEIKQLIKTGIQRNTSKVSKVLIQWNLFEKGDAKVKAQSPRTIDQGLLILLHGPPGTGKTFAAGAIAHELGRDILQADMSLIKSKWVGDSEKNVAKLFQTYARIVELEPNPPILLLNEADQFLFKRINNPDRSVEIMYNSLQNQFLEAFEHLHGILIATTNMRENLDPAFNRRFHLKLEIPKPGLIEREKLWRLHLPGSIPGAQAIDTENLAARYELTGGQILVIVKNAATEAAHRNQRNRILCEHDLLKYCELEIGSNARNFNQAIGFQ